MKGEGVDFMTIRASVLGEEEPLICRKEAVEDDSLPEGAEADPA